MDPKPANQLGLAKSYLLMGVVILLVAAGLIAWFVTSRSSNDSSAYTFKALGVKAALPGALLGMKAAIGQPPAGTKASLAAVTTLQLDSYTALANKCLGLPPGTKQNFANLVKVTNLQQGMPKPLKQFKGFNIVNLGASLPSNVTCKDKDTQAELKSLSNQLNSALSQALNSAQSL